VPIIREDSGVVRHAKITGSLPKRDWHPDDPFIDGMQGYRIETYMLAFGLRSIPSLPNEVGPKVHCRRCHGRLLDVTGLIL